MRYLGGKHRIAKDIAEFIRSRHRDAHTVYEMFMGGGSVTTELAKRFPLVKASDTHPDLVLMWQAAIDGWIPEAACTLDQYRQLRDAEPSAQRGLVGFGMSFGGKWFGGFVGEDTRRDRRREPVNAILKQVKCMENVEVRRASYLETMPGLGSVAYLDPPYAGTTGYGQSFDSVKFWETARAWRRAGVHVYVSEYAAPEDWRSVWSKTFARNMKSDFQSAVQVTEHLFV